jgi:pimeloyl-CoA dehydrogenase
MDFSLSPDQILFRDSVDRFFNETFTTEDGRDKAVDWQALVDMGLTAAPFPDSLGGTGANTIDLMFVANGIGRILTTAPFLPCVVMAGHILRDCANVPGIQPLIEALTNGTRKIAFAELSSGSITQTGTSSIVSGEARLVLEGSADVLILASANHDKLVIIEGKAKGVTCSPFTTLDKREAADLIFSNVTVNSIIAEGHQAQQMIARAQRTMKALLCAEACGAMQATLELTLDYVRTRKQFGRPIGSFQALQHRLVDMRIAYDLADTQTRVAIMAVEEADSPTIVRLSAAAHAQVVKAARLIAEEAIQMHGGMGMTEECRAGKFAKRLITLSILLGSEDSAIENFLLSA